MSSVYGYSGIVKQSLCFFVYVREREDIGRKRERERGKERERVLNGRVYSNWRNTLGHICEHTFGCCCCASFLQGFSFDQEVGILIISLSLRLPGSISGVVFTKFVNISFTSGHVSFVYRATLFQLINLVGK